ncbi:Hemin uptake protein hemP [Caballeronia sp. SBC1]|uniref:hemin uptake protein HemP n=1 Tax=unclassified Caballeronia TaxID=2646786 RepID=UPI0013E0F3E0|nr:MULTISPECIES: hemin uptake protein HemP [unclassified Caballeronia]QIE24341.1 Hemin uptake protein hemP [Caballeronia sp. SBC2]QIN62236.1 Hemin uptake protein hemP [Caballeronia sp. SBC1]
MTDILRSNTLRLRRPVERSVAASISRPRTAAITTARPASSSSASDSGERSLRSDTLLQGHSHISIMHNGETYQLRATRLGKLILTK